MQYPTTTTTTTDAELGLASDDHDNAIHMSYAGYDRLLQQAAVPLNLHWLCQSMCHDGVKSFPVRYLQLILRKHWAPVDYKELQAKVAAHDTETLVFAKSMRDYEQSNFIATTPPPAPLIGIEPNPGPWASVLRRLRFRLHGNYGGPGYSSRSYGKPDWQVPPTDALDAVFRQHDYDYTRMGKRDADALMVQRLAAGDYGHIKHGNLKATLARVGFTIMNLGLPAVPERSDYPWVQKPRPAPKVATAATVAVEPNPGPPKGRRLQAARRPKALKQLIRSLPKTAVKRMKSTAVRPRRFQAPTARGPPVTLPGLKMARRNLRIVASDRDTITLEGQDFLTTCVLATTNAVGDTLFQTPIHPDMFQDSTRLSIISQVYERYKFHGATFHVSSSAPTSDSGAFAIAIDDDPGDNVLPINSGPSAKAWAIAHNGHIVKAWENTTITARKETQQKDYFIDDANSDPRLTLQGRLYMFASVIPTTTVYYDVWMTWRVTLRVNQLDIALSPSVVGYLALSNTNLTAANPFFGGTAPTTTTNIPAGLGLAYTGSNSYLYFRQSYPGLTVFSLVLDSPAGAVVYGTGTTAPGLITGGSADIHASVGTQTRGIAAGLVNMTGAIANSANFTAAIYWNGSTWIAEPSPTVTPVSWFIAFNFTTLTAPTSPLMHIYAVNILPTSVSRARTYLRHHPTAAAKLNDCMCSIPKPVTDARPDPDALRNGERVYPDEKSWAAADEAWRWRHVRLPRPLTIDSDSEIVESKTSRPVTPPPSTRTRVPSRK